MKIWKRRKLIGKYGEIQKNVEKELSCSAHDMDHVMRVYATALKIAKEEKDVDLDILKMATLLHDIARVKEDDDKTGKICHAEESAKMCVPILKKIKYSEEKIKKIQHCILAHRYKNNHIPETIEAKILFDADKLDSLGAIVMVRAGMWMGRNKCSIFPTMPLSQYAKLNLVGGKLEGRIKNKSLHNIFYEHEIKDKKLPEKMFTKKGKEIAVERLSFVDTFMERLQKEADGIL